MNHCLTESGLFFSFLNHIYLDVYLADQAISFSALICGHFHPQILPVLGGFVCLLLVVGLLGCVFQFTRTSRVFIVSGDFLFTLVKAVNNNEEEMIQQNKCNRHISYSLAC